MLRHLVGSLGLVLIAGSISGAGVASPDSARTLSRSATATVRSANDAARLLRRAFPALAPLRLETLRDLTNPRLGTRTLRFELRHRGLPVQGRWASVTLLPSGGARARLARLPRLPNDVAARVSEPAARAIAEHAAQAVYRERAELVLLPVASEARVAWRFRPERMTRVGYAPLTLIDAVTGAVLAVTNTLLFDRSALVHAQNPTRTPDTTAVELLTLPAGAQTLSDPRVVVHNCIDRQTRGDFFYGNEHVCEQEQTALADAQGDFLAHVYASDTDPEDTYAEVAAYYHVSRGYEAMLALGAPELNTLPLPVIVNLRIADASSPGDTGLPLAPFDNAFYWPDETRGSIWFGQGANVDFAYDGDVVYHELGHAVIHRTSGLMSGWQVDAQGATPTVGGIHEGLADYLAAVVSGDPDIAEYAGAGVGLGGPIRSIDNFAHCPESLVGEAHEDGMHFSGAVWAARRRLATDVERRALDAAVLDALGRVTTDEPSYAELAALIVEAATDAAELGEEKAGVLTKAFEGRGILPECIRSFELELGAPLPLTGRGQFYLPGKRDVPGSTDVVPSSLQFHVAFPAGATGLRVEASTSALSADPLAPSTGSPFEPALLVKFAPEAAPLRFESFPWLEEGVVVVGGAAGGGALDAEIPVPEGATHVHVMLANRGDHTGVAGGLSIKALGTPPEDDPEPAPLPPPDDEGKPGDEGKSGDEAHHESPPTAGVAAAPSLVAAPAASDEGCGCVVAASSAGRAPLALFGLLALPWLRRWRRR